MSLEFFMLLLVAGQSAAVHFTVVSPNVLHFDEDETVSVSVEGTNRHTITVSLKDWPDRKNEFSIVRKSVTGHSSDFKVKVSPANFPEDSNRLKQGERRYVYLVAKSGSVVKETTVLVSGKNGIVYLQTDKPIYTPKQTVTIRVYTTNSDNVPKGLDVKIDVMTPQGIVVDRKESTTTGGYMTHTFPIDIRPITGNWSVVAHYGYKYGYNTTVIFEVQEYVLPTFSCKIQGRNDHTSLPNYVLMSENTTIYGKIVAKYSHGEVVKGSALVRVGITKADNTITYRRFKSQLTGGETSFVFNTNEIVYRIPEESRGDINGEKIYIEADCYEWRTGMHMKDVNSQIMFTNSPFKFDFEKTKKYFKPGLPLVFQFELYYVNGRPAAGRQVNITAMGDTANGSLPLTINTKGGDGKQYITTRERGRGRMVYSTLANMERVHIEFEVKDDKVGTIKVTESYVLEKYEAAKDISIKTANKIFKKGDNMQVDVFFKGGTFSEVTIMVLARGQIVYAAKPQDRAWTTNAIIHLPLDSRMIPSARLLVFFTENGVIGGDSLWIDLEDECKHEIRVTTDKPEYTHAGRSQVGSLKFEGKPYSKVAVQMVDHAVLILNERVTLTKEIMFGQLEALDLGCGGGGGSTTSETFQMAGLSVATSLLSNNHNAQLDTGFRMLETCDAYNHDRRKRALQADVKTSDLTECCQMGQDAGVQIDKSSNLNCRSQLEVFFWTHSPTAECTKEYKRCCLNVTNEEEDEDDTVQSAERSSEKSIKDILDIAPKNSAVRQKFPESQVFDVVTLDENGDLTEEFQLPDSITMWSLEAVQMTNEDICVADTYDFRVWKDTFLTINLPYQAVKGEHFLIKATAYNYGNNQLTGEFYMKGVEGLCSSAAPDDYTDVKDAPLEQHGGAATVSWPILPTKAGQYTITFYLLNQSGKATLDIVRKELKVIHEGVKSGTTFSYTLDPTRETHSKECSKAGSKLTCHVDFMLPGSAIPGSASGVISISGNVFGPAVKIVLDPTALTGKMVKPYMCGEQTMIKVAPGVYAYRYMASHDILSGRIETEFPSYVRKGIVQMSKYRKSSGGFGVWESNPESTWLTSFVLKVFAQAYQLSKTSVDKNFLDKAVTFLCGKQTRSGALKGRITEHSQIVKYAYAQIHGAVQANDLTLTAHVLITLMESKKNNIEDQACHLKDTVDYLVKNVKETTRTYEKALVAYALSLTDSPYRIIAYKRLQADAKEELQRDSKVRYFPGTSTKIQVETAAYAVLTALQHHDWDYCYDIVIWLHTQKSNNRMFQTTQDTVIAMQALAEYDVKTRRNRNDLEIKLKSYNGTELAKYEIGNDDVDVEFIYHIPESEINLPSPDVIVIEATGEGRAQISTEIMYHVTGKPKCSFDIDIKFEPPQEEESADTDSGDTTTTTTTTSPGGGQRSNKKIRMNLDVGVSYNDEGATEMAIIEVGLLTGYAADKDTLEKLKGDKDAAVDQYEITSGKVILYISKIDGLKKRYTFSVTKNVDVGGISPASVKVYDYYNTDAECTKLYTEAEGDEWEINYDADLDKCYAGMCGSCYGRLPGYKRSKSTTQLKNVVCTTAVNYVLKLKYLRTEEDMYNTYHYMEVEHALRKGGLKLQNKDTVRLEQRHQCPCPDVDKFVSRNAKSFFVYGKSALLVDDIGGQMYKLPLDKDSYLEPWKFNSNAPHRKLRSYLNDGCKI